MTTFKQYTIDGELVDASAVRPVLMPQTRVNEIARYILAAMDAKGFDTPRKIGSGFDTPRKIRSVFDDDGARPMTAVEGVMFDASRLAFMAADIIEAARCGEPGNALARAYDAADLVGDVIADIIKGDAVPTLPLTDYRMLVLKLGLMVTEVAEAREAAAETDLAHVEEELADIIIRVLHVAAGLGMDMDAAITAKMQANAARPPRHGKATSA